MSLNHNSVNEKDINLLEQMDELVDDLHISTQKAISMTKLNVPPSEAFSEVFRLIDTLEDLSNQVENETAKMVAQGKTQVAKFDLEAKLGMQLKK